MSGKKRWFSLPNVPTLVESGYPGFVTDTFAGMFAPTGTPKEIVDRLAKAAQEALKNPDVIDAGARAPASRSSAAARTRWRPA